MLADGSVVRPDAVIAATGFEPGLEPLVGHLGVIDARGRPVVHNEQTDPRAPGLHFVGYRLGARRRPPRGSPRARATARAISTA